MEGNLQENNNVVTKKNNNSKIVIIVLVVLLVGALGFICYDKFINKEKPPVPVPTPANKLDDEYAEWVNYILNQNITEISYSELSCENQENLTLETEWNKKEITIDDLKEIFKKLKDSKIRKELHIDLGVPLCGKNISITYIKNDKEYSVLLLENTFRIIEDEELNSILEKMKTETINGTCASEEECMSAYYFEPGW